MKKVAFITGGAKGIGRAIVKKFAENQYKVAFTYLNSEDQALSLCKELNNDNELNCIAFKCDIRDYDNVKNCINDIIGIFGQIHVLVNNAGIANYNLIMDMSVKDWRNVMATNLDSVFYTSKECIPYLLQTGGNIVNISSVWGVYGASLEVAYSASKAGVIGFTKALAQELGKSNVRVNCVAPGVIDTDMNKAHSQETLQELCEMTPLDRIGSVEEVADSVFYLASNNASFITGQVLEVTGGFK